MILKVFNFSLIQIMNSDLKKGGKTPEKQRIPFQIKAVNIKTEI